MILHCIRHGESSFNAAGRIQGQLDPPLSELGLQQAQLLAQALKVRPITAIYCSPLTRAVQTATPLAEQLGLPLVLDPRLQEIHAGVFQGLTWPEINDRFPADSAGWKSHNPDFRVTGGETRRELMARGVAVFQHLREQTHKEMAVVTHGGLLGAALQGLLEIPAARSPFRFFNTGWNILAWESEPRLVKLNDTTHLSALGVTLSMGDL